MQHQKVENTTVPLLSPTMELELLKEPWVFTREKLSNITTTATSKVEDNSTTTTFSDWEENFQDLSGWCQDTFQTRCNFPVGELFPFKLSGTKYEGNSGFTMKEQASKENMTSMMDEDKWSLKTNSFEASKTRSNKNVLSLSISRSTSNYKKEVENDASGTAKVNELSSASWLRLPKTATVSTESSKENATFDVNNAPFNSSSEHQQIGDLDFEDTSRNNCLFVPMEDQPEPWDNMLHSGQTNGTDTFDLISYIYEDELHSPTGSTTTDSSIATKSRSPNQQLLPTAIQYVKTGVGTDETTIASTRKTVQTRSTSTSTSPSDVSTNTLSSLERGEKNTERQRQQHSSTRTTAVAATNNVTTKRHSERYENRGKKRSYEEEVDIDAHVTAINYRESREKNNEASRKSRMNKKAKETEMAMRAIELEKDNRILKMKVEELEKLVTSMRSALLQSALKKEN